MTVTYRIHDSWIKEHRPYHPSMFVERTPELDLIQEKVYQGQTRQFVGEPLVQYLGIRGIGKTWLLQHLYHLYRPTLPPFSGQRIPLTPVFCSFSAQLPPRSLRQIGQILTTAVGVHAQEILTTPEQEMLTEADLADLVMVLKALSQRTLIILLLDDVQNLFDNWPAFEQQFIEPLICTNRIIFAIASFPPVPQWTRFEVRRRLMTPYRLQPFDKGATEKQVSKHNSPLPRQFLWPYLAGTPHLTEVILRHVSDWIEMEQPKLLDRAWLDEHRSAIATILEAVETQLLEACPANLRRVLHLLAPLRFYRLEALRFMHSQLEPDAVPQKDSYYLRLLNELDTKTTLVSWQHTQRGYVTNTAVRQIISARECFQSRAIYRQKHKLALKMYWEWVQRYPQTSENLLPEIFFHLAHLYQNQDAHLEAELQKVLHFARENLDSDRFLVVSKQFDEDQELLDLLSPVQQQALVAQINQILSQKATD